MLKLKESDLNNFMLGNKQGRCIFLGDQLVRPPRGCGGEPQTSDFIEFEVTVNSSGTFNVPFRAYDYGINANFVPEINGVLLSAIQYTSMDDRVSPVLDPGTHIIRFYDNTGTSFGRVKGMGNGTRGTGDTTDRFKIKYLQWNQFFSSVSPSINSFLRGVFKDAVQLTHVVDSFDKPSDYIFDGAQHFCFETWMGCSNLVSMPDGFNIPQGITEVGQYFLYNTRQGCESLTHMPDGFNIPQGITKPGYTFMKSTRQGCKSLTHMPDGFNIPQGITEVVHAFLERTRQGCESLTHMPDGFNIPQGIAGAVDAFVISTRQGCKSLTHMPDGFNIPQGITEVGAIFLHSTRQDCESLTHMPDGFNIPQGITGAVDGFMYGTRGLCESLTHMPDGFSIPQGITGCVHSFFHHTRLNCYALKGMPSSFLMIEMNVIDYDKYFREARLNCSSFSDAAPNYTFTFKNDTATLALGGTNPLTPDSPTAGTDVLFHATDL